MTAEGLRRLTPALLLVAVAATAWFASWALRLDVEHDNTSLRSTDAAGVADGERFVADFGADEEIFLAVGHPRLLEAEGRLLVADLTAQVAALDGVRGVWSLANAEELVAGPLGAEPRPLLGGPWEDEASRAAVEAALDRNPDFDGWLVSSDRLTAGLVVELEDRAADGQYRRRLVEALRALGPSVQAGGGELHLTGVPVQKIDVSAYVDRDQRVLLPAAVLAVALTLALFFRRLSGVVVPLAVAGVTVVWTMGLYAATGHATNAITALLPPVLLVIAVAASVHLYDAWLHDHGTGRGQDHDVASRPAGPADAALRAARAFFFPGLLCALTTAQGFASLAVTDLPAVRQFGLFAAFGSLVAFAAAITVAPGLLGRLRSPARGAFPEGGRMLGFLDASSRLATRRPGAVLVGFAVVTAVLATGIPQLRSNTDLVGFLREDAPLRRDTEWMDDRLSGTLALDFLVYRRDGRPVVDLETVRGLEDLEKAILARPEVSGVTSITALARQVNRAQSPAGGLALATDQETLLGHLDLLDESGHGLVRRFASPEMTSLRLTVRLRSVGSAVTSPLVADLRAEAARLLDDDVAFVPVGALWEVVRDSEKLVRRQVVSFSVAIVLVVAAIGLLLRSLLFTMVAMIPNVMPIAWTAGLMGHLGVDLSTGTAMIASAVLGLVVDDTIHYLAFYRKVYAGDVAEAVRRTGHAVGVPVTVASTSLTLGFWVGGLGSFLPTVSFSLLTGLAMMTGLLCDLLLLPAVLLVLDRRGLRPAVSAPPVA